MTGSIERELREAMESKAATYPVDPSAWARVQARAARHRRRRRLIVPVAALAIGAGGAVAVAVVPGLAPDEPTRLAGPTAPGEDTAPSEGSGLSESGDALSRLRACARLHGTPAPKAVQSTGGAPWMVAARVGRHAGFSWVWQSDQRTACRGYTSTVAFSRAGAVEYHGEKGYGQVFWTGTADSRAVRFEARFTDGTRLRFGCDRMWLCDGTISPDGTTMAFATRPFTHRPKSRPGARVAGEFIAYDKDGKALGSARFSTR
ncbi:hypothetical protein [Spirillospora sp. CA-294931]|uniref:hypothetical protein n=1 Tax=Spirillospora sp. CA-294931 TaxID=3240042 RepID=UPI003D94EF34